MQHKRGQCGELYCRHCRCQWPCTHIFPEIQGRFDSLSSWQFSHIRFVGDSTMKRVFDAAVRAHCSRQISCVSSDKLHSDTLMPHVVKLSSDIFLVLADRKDEGQFYNTVKVLQSQPRLTITPWLFLMLGKII